MTTRKIPMYTEANKCPACRLDLTWSSSKGWRHAFLPGVCPISHAELQERAEKNFWRAKKDAVRDLELDARASRTPGYQNEGGIPVTKHTPRIGSVFARASRSRPKKIYNVKVFLQSSYVVQVEATGAGAATKVARRMTPGKVREHGEFQDTAIFIMSAKEAKRGARV